MLGVGREAAVVSQQVAASRLSAIIPSTHLVFISNFSGGDVFRSSCCFQRGKRRIFYFSPRHETYPIYHRADLGLVLVNAVRWAHPPVVHPVETRSRPNAPVNWFVKSEN